MSCNSNKKQSGCFRCLKWTLQGLICVFAISGYVTAQSATLSPDFYVPFDGNLTGQELDKKIVPMDSAGISFIDGVHGQAVLTGTREAKMNSGYVEYPMASLFDEPDGTLMFWVCPLQEAQWPPFYYNFFYVYADSNDNASKNQRIRMFMSRDIMCSMKQSDGKELMLKRKALGEFWPQGDWRHIAFSWNKKGETTLYIDGLPYQHGQDGLAGLPGDKTANLAVQDIKNIFIGTPPGSPRPSQAGMAFDELKVFKRVLTDKEVSAEYRQIAPVDLVVSRRFLRAGEPEDIKMEICSGGVLETPETGIKVPTPFNLEMKLELFSADNQVIEEKKLPVTVNGTQTVSMAVNALPEGKYRFVCSYPFEGGNYRKTFPMEVFRQQSAPVVSNEPLQVGDIVCSIDCSKKISGYVDDGTARVINSKSGEYREAGTNKADRFSYEIEFPHADGSPVILDITWPDDRPRSMGLYMYSYSTEITHHRDRLGGGVQSGDEYPCSGTMQTSRYIFYPWMKSYLFEARTMVPGYPAAVARIEVRPVTGRLLKLPILLPEGCSQRLLGHMDEDQTFEILMKWELAQRGGGGKKYAVDVMELLLDYLDYTGQNAMSYPFIRYNYVFEDLPGAYDGIGLSTKGWQHLMLDMFERRGKKLIATCNANGLPEDTLAPDQNTQDYALHNRYGSVVSAGDGRAVVNPVHPEARRRFLRHIQDVISNVGKHPAFSGIDLWFLPGRSPWAFPSLDVGYGNFTVNLFEQETGIRLGLDDDVPGAFEQRYQLLMGKYRKEWLQWRAEKTTELVAQIDAMLRSVRPDLSLYLTLGGWGREETLAHLDEESFDFKNLFYENYGMDLEALAKLPTVRLTPQRQPLWYRWQRAWDNKDTSANDLMWAPDKFSAFRVTGRAGSCSYMRYFEAFKKSLKPDTFKSYFQNADVKPYGRYFLQELVESLAATDAQTLLIGGQPMGMAGRDEEAREFARAYRALPAGAFADVPGQQDPVVVRYLQTINGTYIYAANRNFLTWTGTVSFASALTNVIDLSTGQSVSLSGDGLSIELKPFELRSFRLDQKTLPVKWQLHISEQAKAWYQNKADVIRSQVEELDGSAEGECFKPFILQIQTAIDNGEFAEAHRLIFSKRALALSQIINRTKLT